MSIILTKKILYKEVNKNRQAKAQRRTMSNFF